jgi:hypothetical protein
MGLGSNDVVHGLLIRMTISNDVVHGLNQNRCCTLDLIYVYIEKDQIILIIDIK